MEEHAALPPLPEQGGTNKAASDEIILHCTHYMARGVRKFYETGANLSKDMGVPLQARAM